MVCTDIIRAYVLSTHNLVVPYIKNSRSKITVNFLANTIDEDNSRTVSSDLKWIADKGLITIGKNKIRINTELFLRDDPKDIVYTGDSCREAIKRMLRLFNK